MTHRNVIRISAAVLAAVAIGCSDTDPMSVPPEERFDITPLFIGLDPGATQQMSATVGGTEVPVSWESSNPAVATVSATGVVAALTPGFTAVTATMSSDATRRVSGNITVLPLLGIGLTKGVPLGPLASNGARGSGVLYRIFVPPGTTRLDVTLRGGTGDADIYVRRATPPTNASFTGFSFNGGNDEDIVVNNPASGTWYILVDLWDPYAGTTLMATYTP